MLLPCSRGEHRGSMKSGLNFLVAARQCEIGELEQLALTSELVQLFVSRAGRGFGADGWCCGRGS